MGISSYSSVRGTVGKTVISNMKQFLVFATCLALSLAAPEAEATPEAEASPDADAFYGQYTWPGFGAVGPYGAVSSTCYGCRPYHFYYGKRSAEPHGTGVAVHPGLATSFNGPTVYGYPSVYGKRDAEPHGTGVAVHPGVATSFRGPTVFGYPSVHYGKRSAEPHGLGVHPGHATSYVGRTIYGYPSIYGKRSADPFYVPVSQSSFSTHGYGPSGYGIGQLHPGAASSY